MTCTTTSAAERIRTLNDDFRRTFVGGMVMITAGVEAMPADQRKSLLAQVRARLKPAAPFKPGFKAHRNSRRKSGRRVRATSSILTSVFSFVGPAMRTTVHTSQKTCATCCKKA